MHAHSGLYSLFKLSYRIEHHDFTRFHLNLSLCCPCYLSYRSHSNCNLSSVISSFICFLFGHWMYSI